MINVKKVLRREGVAGLLKAIGCQSEAANVLAAECGADLDKFWRECPHAGFMLGLALACGVEASVVLDAAQVAVERVVVETGSRTNSMVGRHIDAVAAVLAKPDTVLASASLMECITESGQWLKAHGPISADEPEPWTPLMVCAAQMLGQATWAYVCPCGQQHPKELQDGLDSAMLVVGIAREEHAKAVGRIPKGTPVDASVAWTHNWTAKTIRECIPVELLTVVRMQAIPGVTLDGKMVVTKRPVRGQA